MPLSLIKKPQVKIIWPPLFAHPARNYAASMLAQDIFTASPKRALDAGTGKLRNFHLFPAGSYTGVSVSMEEFDQGLAKQAENIKQLGEPILIVANLDDDFTFLGTFDLVVCTATAYYFKDPAGTLCRLAKRLERQGTLLFEVPTSLFRLIKNSGLVDMFERVEAVPYNCQGIPDPVTECARHIGVGVNTAQDDDSLVFTERDIEKLRDLAIAEMNAATVLDLSEYVYFRCFGRL